MTRRRTKAVAAPPPVIPYACPECDHPLTVSGDAASCPSKRGGCGWRWWVGVPTPTMTVVATPRCAAAVAMVKACGPLWQAAVTAGRSGEQQLDPDRPHASDGSRPNVYRLVPCLSEAVRLAGPGGWRAVATWLSVDDGASWGVSESKAWYVSPRGRPSVWPVPIPVLDLRALIGAPWVPVELTTSARQTPIPTLEVAAA